MDKAWKKFMIFRQDLCGKHASLKLRIKLFSSVVTPAFLYGSGTWNFTAARERKIRTTQRRMIRWILGAERKKVDLEENEGDDSDSELEPDNDDDSKEMDHETWVEWIVRTTGIVEGQLGKAGLDDWCTAVRRKKWRWAGHLARRDDGRWSTRRLDWQPLKGQRKRGRPCKK